MLTVITFVVLIRMFLCKLCGYPGYPYSGSVHSTLHKDIKVSSWFTPGDTVQYSCRKDCRMIGTDVSRCDPSGYWSGSVPLCDCPFTSVMSQQSNTYKSANQNFDYKSHRAIDFIAATCSSTPKEYLPWWEATWRLARTVDFVKIKSGDDEYENVNVRVKDQFQTVTCTLYQNAGMYWTYKCPRNFKSTRLLISRKGGNRKVRLILCDVIIYVLKDSYNCGQPELPIKAKYRFGKEGKFDIYHYSCVPGYTLTSDGRIYCLNNGSWSSRIPHCEITCPHHPGVKNGDISYEVSDDRLVKLGTRLEIVCFGGYEPVDKDIVCGTDGKWNGTAKCVVVDCGPPTHTVHFGYLQFSNTTYNNQAELKCFPGYKPSLIKGFNILMTNVTCASSKKWTDLQSQCQVVDCGLPPIRFRFHLSNNNTKYNSKALVFCPRSNKQSFHNYKHDIIISCSDKATWNITDDLCRHLEQDVVKETVNLANIILGCVIGVVLVAIVLVCCVITIKRTKKNVRETSVVQLTPNEEEQNRDVSGFFRPGTMTQSDDENESATTAPFYETLDLSLVESEHIYSEVPDPYENVYAEPEGAQAHYAVSTIENIQRRNNKELLDANYLPRDPYREFKTNTKAPGSDSTPNKQLDDDQPKNDEDAIFVEENPVYE